MMVTGVFLGRHVQLWEIALWVPLSIQLTSIVRRFERFLADPRVEVGPYFEPFVWAMYVALGNETAYLILDCTQAGPKCRTLVAGLAYHGTVLPLGWQSLKGKKGHVKGEFQKALLVKIEPYLRHSRRVIVLGDAEFSNEPVIAWLLDQKWDFVFRFQHRYQVQVEADGPWQTMKTVYEASQVQAGQVKHWPKVAYTHQHQLPDLTVTVHWGEGETEPLCLVSTLPASEAPHLIYQRRYWIETLFGNHKSRGFQLARTHLTDPAQLDRLILVLAIATCFTLGLGTHLIIIGQSHLVDRTDRRDLSLFQIGFRWFFRLLVLNRLAEFKMVFRWDFKLPPPGFQAAT
jgi:hypothetical protein